MSRKLEIVKRKLIGRSKIDDYCNTFASIHQIGLLDIEDSEIILQKIKNKTSLRRKIEILRRTDIKSFMDSAILRSIYLNEGSLSECYTFSGQYVYCGIFKTFTKEIIRECMLVAKNDFDNTCFILDSNFSFYLRINYYDFEHNDNPDSYDIQVSFYS